MIEVNDLYRCSIAYELHEQVLINTLHWRSTSQKPTDANAIAALTTFNNRIISDIWDAQLEAMLNEDLLLVGVDTVQVAGDGDPHFVDTPSLQAGQHLGNSLPTFVAYPLYLTTGLAGRSHRGRFHVGGLSEDQSDPAGPSAALTTDLVNLSAAILALGTAMITFAGFDLVIWSRTKWLAAGGPALANTDQGYLDSFRKVNAIAPATNFGTMYSRKIGRGI